MALERPGLRPSDITTGACRAGQIYVPRSDSSSLTTGAANMGLHHRGHRRLRSCFCRLRRGGGFPDFSVLASDSRLRRSGIDDVVARRRLHSHDWASAERVDDATLRYSLYLATTVGLVFCGFVTDNFGWRLIFLPNVLFAVTAIRFLVRYFPDVPHPADPRANAADKLGILLLSIELV
jgi:hypothetical protein